MTLVKADRDRCMATGNCVLAAPGHFDQADDDGAVVVTQAEVDPADLDTVQDAVETCPVAAIWLEPDGG